MYVCAGFFFFKQKTAYEMRISDWSSDVCSSDLGAERERGVAEAEVEIALGVEIHRHLAIAQAARIELARAVIAAERDVDAVLDAIVEAVRSIVDRQVEVPAGRLAAQAARERDVVDGAGDDGHVDALIESWV